MTSPIYKTLLDQFREQMLNLAASSKKAQEWFKQNVKLLSGVGPTQIMTSDRQRLVEINGLGRRHIGRMVLFFYDPKLKEKLPYYDMFPMILVIKFYPDGFLGINLHYLPIALRAKLLSAIFDRYKDKHLDENKRLQLDYETLNSSAKYRYFKPCVKRYLYGHVRSKFYVVDPNEWSMMLALPVERFMKKSAAYVWRESQSKLGIRK